MIKTIVDHQSDGTIVYQVGDWNYLGLSVQSLKLRTSYNVANMSYTVESTIYVPRPFTATHLLFSEWLFRTTYELPKGAILRTVEAKMKMPNSYHFYEQRDAFVQIRGNS